MVNERLVHILLECILVAINYQPQRSWAKVMFLQVSVILSTGGRASASVHAGIPPPPPLLGADQTPLGLDPPQSKPPRTRPFRPDPPGKQTPAYGQ